MLELIDILCINCHNLIDSSQIDQHSRTCTHVTTQLVVAENSDAITEIDYKLERLQMNLEATLGQRELSPVTQAVFLKVVEMTKQMLEMHLEELEKVRRVSVFLQSYIREFDGEVAVLFYLERLYFLSAVLSTQTKLRELLLEVSRQHQAQEMHEQLDLKQMELEAYKLEFEYLKEKTMRMQGKGAPDNYYSESFVESYIGTENEY